MYWRDVWRFPTSNENEFKFPGKYGAKGEKRLPKKKATPEQVKKQNQWNREKKVRRLIKANFQEWDLWCTLKYPKGTRKPLKEVKKDKKKFLAILRKAYRKRGESLKFICRLEIGKHGGIHLHILVNRIEGKPNTDVLVQMAWSPGRVNFESVYEYGGYEKLANYIVKQPNEEEMVQLSMFPEEERKELSSYSCSRNLIRPEPERTKYSRRTVRKLIEEGPKPTPGYYIDKNSIYYGVNPYTGMTHYQYTEYKLGEGHPNGEDSS